MGVCRSILALTTFAASALPLAAAEAAASVSSDWPPSFRYDVLPALSKHGCSAGACHGSPSGKGGFRLSLRGFDPQLDRRTLTREAFGRRVNRLAPEQSLILLKPTTRVAHGGGRKLKEGDLAYRILHRWIAGGCQIDSSEAPTCRRIEVSPTSGEYRWPDRRHSLHVTAHFVDGSTRDITPLAVFSSSDDEVATVDREGVVQAKRRGTATILVRYLDFVATARFTFLKDVEGFTWQTAKLNNDIDRIVFSRLQKLQIQPSSLTSDDEFIRRIYLDLLGILPGREETETFLADQRPDKRRRLIDQLLERPEHARFWAQKWADLLRVRAGKIGDEGVRIFHQWLVKSVADNMPYDEFVTALLTAQGNTHDSPPANYYRAAGDVNDCAETTSQLFLGVRIQCAKCHNHPFDRWSQDNYYGIGAFFSRVERKPVEGQDRVTIALAGQGEVTQPRTGRQMKPWLPLAGEVEIPQDQDRRAVLAHWLTAPDNPFFARVAVNRIWGQLFGRGIVEPVDDFNAANPPSHPDLLDHLAEQFVADGYDQKQLIRTIVNSRVYQLSSRTNEYNHQDDQYFSHARARMLSAEQLLDAIGHVTGVPERFAGLPAQTRATGLPSPDFGNEFLQTFGQPARNTVCECERVDEPNLARALQLINGPLLARKLRDRRGRIGRLFDNLPGRLAAAGEPPDAGLVTWFKADADVLGENGRSAADGEAVARWTNQTGDAVHAWQENEDRRPQLIKTAIGGLPALRFDGKNDLLHNPQQDLLPSGAPRTVVVVGRVADDTGGALFTFGRRRTDGAAVFTAQHVVVRGTYYVYSDGVNSAGNTTAARDAFTALKDPFVTSFVSPGAAGKLRVRLNGSDLSTTQPGSVGPDQGSKGFTIGSREDLPIGSQMFTGDIAEVLIYDRALSDEQLGTVGTYLATKYDLDTQYPQVTIAELSPPDQQALRNVVTDLYFAAYCRPASEQEIDRALSHVAATEETRSSLEDLMWALLNSKEFLFQH